MDESQPFLFAHNVRSPQNAFAAATIIYSEKPVVFRVITDVKVGCRFNAVYYHIGFGFGFVSANAASCLFEMRSVLRMERVSIFVTLVSDAITIAANPFMLSVAVRRNYVVVTIGKTEYIVVSKFVSVFAEILITGFALTVSDENIAFAALSLLCWGKCSQVVTNGNG